MMDPLAWRPTPRVLLSVGAGLIAVLLVAGGAWYWLSAQSERAQAVHAEALAQAYAARSGQAPAAKTAAMTALESAMAQSPGAPLAAQSAYELGNLRFDLTQYAPARAAYELALTRASSPTIRTLARAGIAAAWESEHKFPQAVDAYTSAVAGEKPGQFYYEDLVIGLGRTQELAGRRDDAVKTYQRLLKDAPKLRRETEVRGRLASLGVSG